MDKQTIRDAVWRQMETHHVARFPGAKGRIPNFIGAEKCAPLVGNLEVWKKAQVIKANPDSPQRAVRQLALKEGKVIYMAVPRLRDKRCFIELDPASIGAKHFAASTIKGAFKYGKPVFLEQMKEIDLILCGSVAINRHGQRAGKGGGYSDLEYALARNAGKITQKTPIITTIHDIQIINEEIDLKPHDITVDWAITPTEVVCCAPRDRRPTGIYWEFLEQEKIDSIPVLAKMRKDAETRSAKR